MWEHQDLAGGALSKDPNICLLSWNVVEGRCDMIP